MTHVEKYCRASVSILFTSFDNFVYFFFFSFTPFVPKQMCPKCMQKSTRRLEEMTYIRYICAFYHLPLCLLLELKRTNIVQNFIDDNNKWIKYSFKITDVHQRQPEQKSEVHFCERQKPSNHY